MSIENRTFKQDLDEMPLNELNKWFNDMEELFKINNDFLILLRGNDRKSLKLKKQWIFDNYDKYIILYFTRIRKNKEEQINNSEENKNE